MSKRILQLLTLIAAGGGVATLALYDSGNTIPIASGDSTPSTTDGTDFGTSPVGTTATKIFTYRNTGQIAASISAISVPSNFTVLTALPLAVAAGGTATFQIRLSAGAIDPVPSVTYSGTVTVTSNATNSSYTFAITGVIEVAFLLRDDLNSGSVAAGTRTATHNGSIDIRDASTLLSIATDLAQATGGGAASPDLQDHSSRARTAGRMAAIKVASTGVSSSDQFGWASTNGVSPTATHYININNTAVRINPAFPTLDSNFNDAPYWRAVILRTAGAYYFMRGGKWGNWQLIHVDRTGTTTPLYATWVNSATPAKRYSDMLVPDVLWTPTPIVSDDFNRADGAIGTSDSYEGGTNTAWSSAVGTAAIVANLALLTALSGGVGIATIEASNGNVIVVVSGTRVAAGAFGIVVRYADSSNYIKITHDGTNLNATKVVAGSPTSLATKAITYSAGADLVVTVSVSTTGGEVSAVYNGVHLTATPSAFTNAALVSATKVGIISTDTLNTFDNFICWPNGAAGEHNSYLSVYAQRTETEKIYLAYEGDSLTLGTQGLSADGTDSYPRQAITTLTRAAYDYCNYAVSGQTVVSMLADDEYTIGALAACYSRKICILWGGTNDIAAGDSATTVYNNIVAYAAAQKALGYKVLVCTIIVRGSFSGAQETIRTTINSNIVANAATFANGYIDLAADSRLQNFNDTTYFNADTTHLKAAGYAVVAGLAVTAIQAVTFP